MNSRVFRIAAPLAIAMLMAAAPAKASPQSSVTAGGAVELPAEFGESAGDHVQLHVTARQGPDGSAQGRFSIVHQRPPGLWARASGIVTCLAVSGDRAVVTGVITHGNLREGGDVSGDIATFTLSDRPEGDTAGLAFSFWGIPIDPCEPLPTILTWSQGNITVHE